MAPMALLQFRTDATPVDIETGSTGEPYRLAGMVVPWHTEFVRAGQRFTFTPESLELPYDLGTIKLLIEHDPERPVGFAVDAAATVDGLDMRFEMPATFGRSHDAAQEYTARLRDGFSVGVEPNDETNNAIYAAMVEGPTDKVLPLAGTVREVSIVAIPQFNNARGSMERKTTKQLVTLATMKDRTMPDTDTVPSVANAIETFRVMESPEFAELAGRVAAIESGNRPGVHPLARFNRLADALKAGLDGNAERLNFVLADNTSEGGKNAGVVPPSFLTTVVGVIARRRAAIEAFGGPGRLPADGFTTHWPYYDGNLSALVGIQATQKTDITSAAVDIKNASANIKTYAGGADNALQLIERSSPAFLDVWGRIMAAAYAVVTENDFTAQLSAGATGTETIVWATATAEQVRTFLFAASAEVDAATGGPAEFMLAAPDVFALLGGLTGLHNPTYGTNNAAGTSSAATLQINVNGLPIIKANGLPAGEAIVSNREAARFMEDGPSFIDAVNVSKLGRDSAIYGYGATHIYIPAGLVKSAAVVQGDTAVNADHGKRK